MTIGDGGEGQTPAANIEVVVVDSHMTSEYEVTAAEICRQALATHKQLKDIAQHIKQAYDAKYPGSGKATEGVFHCIVGRNFATALSHETRMYIHLKAGTYHIILWKSKDSPFKVTET